MIYLRNAIKDRAKSDIHRTENFTVKQPKKYEAELERSYISLLGQTRTLARTVE